MFDGGTVLTDYQVSSDGGTTWLSTATTSTLSYTFSGLTNGTSYSFTVRAENAVGTGDAAAPVSAVPVAPPAPPTDPTTDPTTPPSDPTTTTPPTPPTPPGGGSDTGSGGSGSGSGSQPTTPTPGSGGSGGSGSQPTTTTPTPGSGSQPTTTTPGPVPPGPSPRPVLYQVLSQFGTWNGRGTVSGRIDAPLNKFLYLLDSNGNRLSSADFKATSGSTIITFTQAYLNTLPNGSYHYKGVFTDGESAQLTLVIERSAHSAIGVSPHLGDFGGFLTPLLLLFVAGVIVAVVDALYRRREEQQVVASPIATIGSDSYLLR